MQTVKLSALFVLCVCVLLTTGCNSELKDLKTQNAQQRKLIDELTSDSQAAKLKLAQLTRQLETARGLTSAEKDALQQKIAALEEGLAKKKALIATMQNQLLMGGAQLPVELNAMLEDFANKQEMVTYDSSRGLVKFKSDLLFEKGSDQVAATAEQAVKELCNILNSKEATQFDIIIAGHTDDIRIAKPATLRKHPTNWHLSAHRGISVLNVMANNNIVPGRMSIRGFGEFRPLEPNKPGKKGNPKNRRVEIYIVPKGM